MRGSPTNTWSPFCSLDHGINCSGREKWKENSPSVPTQHVPINRWNPKDYHRGLAFGHPSQDLALPPDDPGRWKMVIQGPGFLQVRQGWGTELAGSPQANYTRHGCWAWSSGPWRVKEIFLSHKSYRE